MAADQHDKYVSAMRAKVEALDPSATKLDLSSSCVRAHLRHANNVLIDEHVALIDGC